MAYSDLVMALNPESYWKLDETTGNFMDLGFLPGLVGTNTQLVPGTGITRSVAGPARVGGNGVTLTNGYAVASNYPFNNWGGSDVNRTFAVEFWFKSTDADSTLVQFFVSPYWWCSIDANGKLWFSVGPNVSIRSTASVNDNVWHHVVLNAGGPHGVTMYLDGVPVAASGLDSGTFTVNGPLYIGDNRSPYSLTGSIDDVAIYSAPLTSAQVLEHYNGTNPNALTYADKVKLDKPIGYWRMENGTTYDEITSSAALGLVGTPVVGAAKHGNGWSMNGNVSINLTGTYQDFTSDGSFSIESWFRLPTTFTPEYPTIWRRDGNGQALLLRARSHAFASGAGPGRLEVYLNNTASFYSPGRYDDNQWHHTVMTVGNGVVRLYVDGEHVNWSNCGTGWNVNSPVGSGAICAGGPDPANGEGWAGGLDEPAIYNYPLSATQVKAHYLATAPVVAMGFRGWGLRLP